uniref:Uncharacterized protein n=1 Tax=Anguilla anguilla TaxID=7936 RepID=A0A0E9WL25_ANGAN
MLARANKYIYRFLKAVSVADIKELSQWFLKKRDNIAVHPQNLNMKHTVQDI